MAAVVNTDGRKPEQAKSLPGSFEDRAGRLRDALKEAAILPAGDMWVTDTFADSVVVCLWSPKPGEGDYTDYEQQYYQVEISAETDAGFEFGAIKEVEKQYTERLVDAKAAGGVRTKARSPFALKSITKADDDVGGWNAEGVFSVFDHEDHSRDIVRKGATTDSIAQHLPKILDHHGVTVGQATSAAEEGGGLAVKFRVYPTRAGEDLVKLMQPIETDLGPHAPVEQGSIGFSPMEGGAKRRQGGGWEYTKLWIWEVSPVTFGDNDRTSVGLKSMADVHAMPTGELLGYAGECLRLAVDGAGGAKALYRRRLDDERPLSDAQWKAIDGLVVDASEAVLELVTLKGRAGKAASNAHLRHVRAIVESLSELVHGRGESPAPAPEPEEREPVDDDPKKVGGAKARAGGDAPRSKDLREMELILADLGLAYHAEVS